MSCLIVCYGMFYFIAWFLESRLPGIDAPIWRNQSKAFFPGDAGLSLMVAVGSHFMPAGFTKSVEAKGLLLLASLVGLIVFVFARKYLYTPKDYSLGAWYSPSKRYHDIVMYWWFTIAALYVCVPGYLMTPWHSSKLLGLFGLLIWAFGNYWDFKYKEVPNEYQHPTFYEPIWEGRKKE